MLNPTALEGGRNRRPEVLNRPELDDAIFRAIRPTSVELTLRDTLAFEGERVGNGSKGEKRMRKEICFVQSKFEIPDLCGRRGR
jgi:hypothetical protein